MENKSLEIIKREETELLPFYVKKELDNQMLPEERKFIYDALQPKIKNVEILTCIDTLIDVISSAYVMSGQKIDDQQLSIYASETYNRLYEQFPDVTVEEVRQAIRNGLFDEYGEYFGLNPKSFVGFVKAYLFSIKREMAKELYGNIKKRLDAGREEIAPYHSDEYWTDEMRGSWVNITEICYRWYLEDDPMIEATAEGVYWLLKRRGKIIITDEYISELMELAKAKERRTLLLNESRKKSDEIKYLMSCIDDLNKDRDVHRNIRLCAKKIAVFKYFEQCKKEGKKFIY